MLIPAGPAPAPGPQPAPGVKGCTKAGCCFSTIQGGQLSAHRCGEVDAAKRMPDDIWNDAEAVRAYIEVTKTNFFLLQLQQGQCAHGPARA